MADVGNYRDDLDMSMLDGKITFKKSNNAEMSGNDDTLMSADAVKTVRSTGINVCM
jgi:hypothetical protein